MMENVNAKIWLAFFLVIISAAMVFLWMVYPPKAADANALALLAGFVTLFIKMAADAIGYQYNSSAGSEKKDTTQAKVAEKLAEKAIIADGATAALQAASIVAPVAAAVAAPPAAEEAAPEAAEAAVRKVLKRGKRKP